MVGELLVCIAVSIAVVLLGKAIVSYEIFTNKALPRRGFLQQWRYIVLVSALFGIVVSWSLTVEIRPIYASLLTTVFMTLVLAIWSWRSYREHERHVAGMRPFVSSQGLYEHVLAADDDAPDVAHTAFEALCRDVLDMRPGFLFPLGALSSMVGAPLRFPDNVTLPATDDLQPQLQQFGGTCWEIEPEKYGGAIWAVPLWSERGLVGVLLLGPKNDGSLYTQEEIEIARSSGERIIDARAGAVMAQRLMALQRRHLAESQVLDRRARRALHDDVLPRVHTAILTLSALRVLDEDAKSEAMAQLSDAHRQVSNLLREMPLSPLPQIQRSGFIGTLQQSFDTEWKGAFDSVQWNVDEGFEESAQCLHPLTGEVLFYAIREVIRNAVRYGRGDEPERALNLNFTATSVASLNVVIEDNGVGFQPGEVAEQFAKNAIPSGGSGRGLALHSTMMAIVGGTLALESKAGQGTRVSLLLPPNAHATT
jgi:signal transduction histidine kinase